MPCLLFSVFCLFVCFFIDNIYDKKTGFSNYLFYTLCVHFEHFISLEITVILSRAAMSFLKTC